MLTAAKEGGSAAHPFLEERPYPEASHFDLERCQILGVDHMEKLFGELE